MVMHSAIYQGRVQHRRLLPRTHRFSYRVFMLWLDLAELDTVFARRWLWSINRRNLAAFHRVDSHGDPATPLEQDVRATVAPRAGTSTVGALGRSTHASQSR